MPIAKRMMPFLTGPVALIRDRPRFRAAARGAACRAKADLMVSRAVIMLELAD